MSVEDIDALRAERERAGVPDSVHHTLTDMRRVQFVFDIDELRSNETDLPPEKYAGSRQAELVTDPHTTAVLLIWRKWLPEGVVVEIFSTPEAAYEWLGVEQQAGDLDI